MNNMKYSNCYLKILIINISYQEAFFLTGVEILL
jgi:hypothetical protein